MKNKIDDDDTTSHASTFAFTTEPSSREPTIVNGYWESRDEVVPWPGNVYIIMEKGSDRALTVSERGLCLQSVSQGGHAPNNRWRCVEKNGYFGFYSVKSGVFIGHDMGFNIRALARNHGNFELMTARRHPKGGYQLMLPHWWHTLMAITVTEDGSGLVTRKHGETLWEFLEA